MISAPLPPDESERLKSLSAHQLLDTLPEEVYDDITRIASEICGTPIALLTLVDEDRQWFKSKQGVSLEETPREQSFCAHAILNPNEPFVVPDARYDERFHDNPLTTGDSRFVFYAGVPVQDAEGHALGSLCVIDNRPRELTEQKLESLKALAKLVNAHFQLRKAKMDLEESRNKNSEAQEKASVIWNEVQALIENQPDPKNSFNQLQQTIGSLKALFEKD